MIIATLIAGSLGQSILSRLVNDVAGLIERTFSVAWGKAQVQRVLGEYTNPEELLKKVAPSWSRDEFAKALRENPKIHGVVDFLNFLRDFNMRFAEVNVGASILGSSAAYATTQIGSAYQWSYGLGWLSWIGTGQVLQKLVAEPIGQELDRLFRHKLLTESAAKELWTLGLISTDEFKEYLAYQGYSDEKIELLKKALINDLVSGKVATLVRLRLLDERKVIARLKEIGVPEDKAALAVHAAFAEPSLSVILKSLKAQRITKEEAVRWLKLQGYSDDAIALILDSAKEERIEADKQLTKSEILQMFRYHLIDEQTALNGLEALGYDPNEARLLIQLTKAKIPTERISKGRDLSKSDILQALRLGVISENEAVDMLKRIGYDDTEIGILLAINKRRMEKEPKLRKRELVKSDVIKALRLGLITAEEARTYLRNLGYSDADISILLKFGEVHEERHRELTTSEIGRAFREGIISEAEAKAYWKNLGYGDWEIAVLLRLYSPKAS